MLSDCTAHTCSLTAPRSDVTTSEQHPGTAPCNVLQNVWCAKAFIGSMPAVSRRVATEGELLDAGTAAGR